MTALRRILPFLKQEKTALILASIAMAIYAIATALYAYLSGPALKLIFTGESLELPSGLKPPTLTTQPLIGFLSRNQSSLDATSTAYRCRYHQRPWSSRSILPHGKGGPIDSAATARKAI